MDFFGVERFKLGLFKGLMQRGMDFQIRPLDLFRA